ncbi:hypothetical protein A3C96_00765 [Candidatus Uhrbacteria bacterium RIFCSPHIGHO2_02_FULL_60_10]|uniref:DUF5667 domain-containing protein n=1 Tax=Candidatus Uhrbacteria bacterium RIFCSPHIGHO2_02_FULL_60_10 TaxID=1802392 RepID=A0A1F7U5C2_9BACT|nr:MAG: hypothetical protein A3C96_00765 [Candidatus Uhrbacteria bacterium RIFCSPHIGHO2_02_FULL_60_10]
MQVRNQMDRATRPTLAVRLGHLFSIFVPTESLMLAGRVVAVFLLAAVTVVAGGFASVGVYRHSEPGQTGYAAKVAIEKIQLIFAPNADYRVRLLAEYADRRLDEIAKLADSAPAKRAAIAATARAFEQHIAGLEAALLEVQQADPDGVVEVAKLLERKVAIYQDVLAKSSVGLPADAVAALAAARNRLDEVSIKSLAVIVEKHLQGNAEAPKSVLVSKFDDRLHQAEAKADAAVKAAPDAAQAAKAKAAQAAIAATKQLIKEEKYEAALSKMAEVVELTKESELVAPEAAAATDTATDAATDTATDAATDAATPADTNQPTGDSTESPAPKADDAVGSGSR